MQESFSTNNIKHWIEKVEVDLIIRVVTKLDVMIKAAKYHNIPPRE